MMRMSARGQVRVGGAGWVAGGLVAVFLAATVGVAEAARLSFEPEMIYADSAEVFALSVVVSEVDSLRGYELDVAFDETVLQFVGAERGDLFSGYTPPQGIYWSVQSNGGLLHVECLIIPQDECVAAPGEIVRLEFCVVGNRTETEVALPAAVLRACDGSPISPVATGTAHVVAGSMTGLYFDPDPRICLGDGFPADVTLQVEEVDSLRGFQLFLTYDPARLVFEGAQVGALLGGETPPWPLWWVVVDEPIGTIRIEGVILGPGLFVHGPGELVSLEFTGRSDEGSTPIVFDQWHLWDVETAELYPVAVDDGLVLFDAGLQSVEAPSPGDTRLAFARLLGSPGPAPAAVCWAGTAGRLRAGICDILGRRVRELTPLPMGDSRFLLRWDGRGAEGAPLPAGAYWFRIDDALGGASARVLLVR